MSSIKNHFVLPWDTLRVEFHILRWNRGLFQFFMDRLIQHKLCFNYFTVVIFNKKFNDFAVLKRVLRSHLALFLPSFSFFHSLIHILPLCRVLYFTFTIRIKTTVGNCVLMIFQVLVCNMWVLSDLLYEYIHMKCNCLHDREK